MGLLVFLDFASYGVYNRQNAIQITPLRGGVFVKRLSTFVLSGTLLACAALAQEGPKPLLHVAIFKVQLGKTAAWAASMKKIYVPMFEKLMADGAVQGYGIDLDVLHQAGMPNASAWYTVDDYAGYDKVQSAIEQTQAANAAVMQEIADLSDMDKHYDLLLRIESGNGKPVAAGSRPYTAVSSWKVKPGKAEAFRKGFDKYEKPVLDKLVANGVIHSYQLLTEAVHSSAPGTHWLAVVEPSLASEDKVDAAFREDEKKRSELERSTLETEFREMIEMGAHRDFLMRATVFVSK
jgi:hypothetical protein